jgi:hypothetical protein
MKFLPIDVVMHLHVTLGMALVLSLTFGVSGQEQPSPEDPQRTAIEAQAKAIHDLVLAGIEKPHELLAEQGLGMAAQLMTGADGGLRGVEFVLTNMNDVSIEVRLRRDPPAAGFAIVVDRNGKRLSKPANRLSPDVFDSIKIEPGRIYRWINPIAPHLALPEDFEEFRKATLSFSMSFGVRRIHTGDDTPDFQWLALKIVSRE